MLSFDLLALLCIKFSASHWHWCSWFKVILLLLGTGKKTSELCSEPGIFLLCFVSVLIESPLNSVQQNPATAFRSKSISFCNILWHGMSFMAHYITVWNASVHELEELWVYIKTTEQCKNKKKPQEDSFPWPLAANRRKECECEWNGRHEAGERRMRRWKYCWRKGPSKWVSRQRDCRRDNGLKMPILMYHLMSSFFWSSFLLHQALCPHLLPLIQHFSHLPWQFISQAYADLRQLGSGNGSTWAGVGGLGRCRSELMYS